jgi:anti-anti-sigma factor
LDVSNWVFQVELSIHKAISMALSIHPVALSFQVGAGENTAQISAVVEVVASGPQPALVVGRMLARLAAKVHFQVPMVGGTLQANVMHAPTIPITTPYMYVIGDTCFVRAIPMPKRIDDLGVREITGVFAGLMLGRARGCIFDAALLEYIQSMGIGTLADAVSKGLNIVLFRPHDNIRKVIEMVGLHHILPIQASLDGSIEVLAQKIHETKAAAIQMGHKSA